MVNIHLLKRDKGKSSLDIAKQVITKDFSDLKEVVIEREEKGKPYVANADNIFFNISHSGEYMVIAVANCRVGIDIEKKRHVNVGIAKRYFTEDEYKYIGNSSDRFFEIWTLKESYVKYIGSGISGCLNKFSVIEENSVVSKIQDCNFYTYALGEYVIALCCEGEQKIKMTEVNEKDE